MSGAIDYPSKPLRTWQPMFLWTAGILLALGLLWFFGALVAPLLQIRAAVYEPLVVIVGDRPVVCQPKGTIARLGGPEAAARKLRTYLRMPEKLAPNKHVALVVLGHCGAVGAPTLEEFMAKSEDPGFIAGSLAESEDPRAFEALVALATRYGNTCAVAWLGESRDPGAFDFLISLLGDERAPVRAAAAFAVGQRQGSRPDKRAAEEIRKLLDDKDERVRQSAANALKKIVGEEPEP